MIRRTDVDESDVRVRPGKGSRPRSKRRPQHADATEAMVTLVDRGRWRCAIGGDPQRRVTAMRARELGRTQIVVGDRVRLVGDLSGRPDTLARIVRVEERATSLMRTVDDTDATQRLVVANAEQLIVVTAVAEPEPRIGFVDRCLVAAYAGGLEPVLCLTKTDLADPEPFAAHYRDLGIPVLFTRYDRPPDELAALLGGRVSALVGQSGVGKSTLVNALVPTAEQRTAAVSGVGKGRHTTVAALALPLEGPEGGWVIDTPGVRSFGLAHVRPDDVINAFGDLAEATEDCPRGCGHLGPPADPECVLDTLVADGELAPARLAALRRILEALSATRR
ncbi:ribosome biogenesis GTPase [Pseudonocardia thermophila]|uniref:Small ribosomal subunit biogenesis GTPase RsgA n=1 Tax=Pseudonocardia thermophila TaxID=1848 RepID=A0A1M6TK13_PSETH|nr:ribosome small subunit-dependent GTPase A [Pseudonocardia thermophila]SHK57301.1 ribosome biogenesis GTPase [Pseudonocardia thermophila]